MHLDHFMNLWKKNKKTSLLLIWSEIKSSILDLTFYKNSGHITYVHVEEFRQLYLNKNFHNIHVIKGEK